MLPSTAPATGFAASLIPAALPPVEYARVPDNPEVSAIAQIDALDRGDLIRLRALAESGKPIPMSVFVELFARVTAGEITAMLVRPRGSRGDWALASVDPVASL